jgi:outer membrane receptor protein involved in Fe transport
MLSAQFLEQPSTPRVDELVPGFGQDHPASGQYQFHPNRRSFLHARYRLVSGSRMFEKLEIHLARQIITDDRVTQDYHDPVIVNEQNESELDGLTLQFLSPWGGSGSEMTWGLEYYADEVSSSRLLLNTDNDESSAARGRFPDASTMDSGALYLNNGWEWPAFSLQAGLRYSWFDIFVPATVNASGHIEDVRLRPDDLTGDLHFTYRFSPMLHIVSNVGRGFRPPNIFDLGTLGPRPGNRFNVPNTDLKPESLWSYDLGLKSVTGQWEAEIFVFYSDYRDKINSTFTGETTPEGRQVVRSDNLNDVKLYGIESGLRWHAASGLEVYAVFNYTRGEESDAEHNTVNADRVPPLNGRVGLVYAPGNGLRLEPFADFAGRQDRLSPRDIDDPRINPEGTPGWGTLNLLLSWQAGAGMELGLRLENLADKNFREHGSGIDAPGRNIGFWLNTTF